MQIEFHYRETWLHRVNPSFKLLLSVILFIVVLLQHNPNVLLNITIVSLVTLVLFNGHPGKRLVLYFIPAMIVFVSSMSSMMFYGEGHTTWFRWGLIHITEESFYRGVAIGLKSLNFAIFGLLYALTTQPVRLFYSLMQQCKLPPKYAYSFMAAMRLLPIMLDEFQTLRHALAVRGAGREKGLKKLYAKVKAYAVPMLAQSIRRAQRVAVAMEAKRFAGNGKRTYYYELKYSLYDARAIVYFAFIMTAAYLLASAYPYFAITDVRYAG